MCFEGGDRLYSAPEDANDNIEKACLTGEAYAETGPDAEEVQPQAHRTIQRHFSPIVSLPDIQTGRHNTNDPVL